MGKTRRVEILSVQSIKRTGTSVNGNPRFDVTFTDGRVAGTANDVSISYALNNAEYRNVPLKVTFTGVGKIEYWEVYNGTEDA